MDKFKCSGCTYVTKWIFSANEHIGIHNKILRHEDFTCISNLEPFCCFLCKHKTDCWKKLHKHIKLKHQNKIIEKSKKVKCRRNQNTNTTYKGPFICFHCEKKCKTRNSMVMHFRSLHERRTQTYRCDQCSYTGLVYVHLQRHIRFVHRLTKNHACKFCPLKVKTMQELNTHIKVRHTSHDKIEWLSCHYCSKKFKIKTNLYNHVTSVHSCELNREILQCSICDNYKTTSKINFNRHMKNMHGKVEWLTCSYAGCDYKSRNRGSNLKSHNLRHHTDKSEWQKCPQCEFRTPHQRHIKRHVLTKHDNLRPFTCPMCLTFKAASKAEINAHIVIKHTSPDKIKWFSCDPCSKKFKTKTQWQMHNKKYHTDNVQWIKCFCGYKAVTNSEIKAHQFVHKKMSERPHACSLCKYKASQQKELRDHIIRRHTPDSESPWYYCYNCSYQNKIKAALVKHIKKHHS